MQTEGVHEIADVWLEPDMPAVDLPDIIQAALTGPGNMTVLAVADHQFEPQGETWMWLLSESHCSLHTFPEHNYFSLDIYGCGAGDPTAAMDAVLAELPPATVHRSILARGNARA